jgi:hypothetical protein
LRCAPASAPLVLMPETPMHINDFLLLGKCEVRFTGQVAPMKPESIAQLTRDSADAHFRFCMTSTDGAHIGAALILGDSVRQVESSSSAANFLRSHSNTARCSSWPARRTCDFSHIALGFSVVMFFAP